MKKLLIMTFICSFSIVYSQIALNPFAPVQAAVDPSLGEQTCCPVAVANKVNEILVVWLSGSNSVSGSWSQDNGVTWSDAPVSIPVGPNGSQSYPFLASDENGFVFTFIDSGTGIPSSVFYNSFLGSWGPEISIDPAITTGGYPIFVSATSQGFLTTFLDTSGNGYANLSANGSAWQASSSSLFTSGDGFSVTSISGCGNQSRLLATWVDGNTGDVYVSSSPDGADWSAPTAVLTGTTTQSPPASSGCFANSQGFVIVYLDSSSNIWSLFSSDGINWSSLPSLVADTNGFAFYYQTPQVTGSNSGFVTTWINNNNYAAYISFSADGKNWESPVQLTSTDAFAETPFYYLALSTSVYQNHCLFSWNDSVGNIFVATSSFPSSAVSQPEKKWGFIAPTILNRPRRQF